MRRLRDLHDGLQVCLLGMAGVWVSVCATFDSLTAQDAAVEVLQPAPLRQGAVVLDGPRAEINKRAREGLAADMWQLSRVELDFARRVATLDATQYEALRERLKQQAGEQNDLLNENRADPFGPTVVFAGRSAVIAQTSSGHALDGNPLRRVRKLVGDGLRELAGEEQYQRYQQASASRDAFRRDAHIRVVVALLDQPLALSDTQREKLRGLLDENWESADLFPAENYLLNAEYYPTLPPEVINQVLTVEQRTVWNALQKVSFNFQISKRPAEVNDAR